MGPTAVRCTVGCTVRCVLCSALCGMVDPARLVMCARIVGYYRYAEQDLAAQPAQLSILRRLVAAAAAAIARMLRVRRADARLKFARMCRQESTSVFGGNKLARVVMKTKMSAGEL